MHIRMLTYHSIYLYNFGGTWYHPYVAHTDYMHTPPTATTRFLGLHAQYNMYKSPFCLRFAVSL